MTAPGRGRPWVLRSRRARQLTPNERALESLRILEVRAAGKPDRLADASAQRRAARMLRGTRATD